VFEKQSGSVIARAREQNTCTENGTPALTLLGDFEVLYTVCIEKITNNHFGL